MSGKVYTKWINLSDSTSFVSALMGSGYGRLQIDIDLYEDPDGKALTSGATGNAVFTAQTTSNEKSTATIKNSTIDVSKADYDRPYANGRVERVHGDLSGINGGKWVRVEIWRGE